MTKKTMECSPDFFAFLLGQSNNCCRYDDGSAPDRQGFVEELPKFPEPRESHACTGIPADDGRGQVQNILIFANEIFCWK